MKTLTSNLYFLLSLIITLLGGVWLVYGQPKYNKTEPDNLVLLSQAYITVLQYESIATIKIPKQTIVIDRNGNKLEIRSLLDKKKVFFRIMETNCFKCVEKYLPYLSELSRRLGPENIVLIGTFQKPRNLFLALEKYKVPTESIFYISSDFLSDNAVEQLNTPYVFTLDATMVGQNVFLPNKDLPELSRFYGSNLLNILTNK